MIHHFLRLSLFIYCLIFATFHVVAGDIVVDSLEDTIANDGRTTLREAIATSKSGDHITFSSSMLPGTITIQYESTNQGALKIEKKVYLDGPGKDNLTINGNNQSRIFFVQESGDLRLSNLTLSNAQAKGGNGGHGWGAGGGAAGMGAALFVDKGRAMCTNVSFIQCQSIGGNGGNTRLDIPGAGGCLHTCGGGGGVGGNGGNGSHTFDGPEGAGGSGGVMGTTDGRGGVGGGTDGNFGGGGGGGYNKQNQGFTGGKGGFGGGGGGGAYETAGSFGGTGVLSGEGGGGAGLGGAIFVRTHGTLLLNQCHLENNMARGGSGGGSAPGGQGKAGAVFAMDSSNVTISETDFQNNSASSANGNGIQFSQESDTNDVYGVVHERVFPEVVSFTRVRYSPTSSKKLDYRLTFSSPVGDVKTSQFSLNSDIGNGLYYSIQTVKPEDSRPYGGKIYSKSWIISVLCEYVINQNVSIQYQVASESRSIYGDSFSNAGLFTSEAYQHDASRVGTLTVNNLEDNTIPNDGKVTLREALIFVNSGSTQYATDLGQCIDIGFPVIDMSDLNGMLTLITPLPGIESNAMLLIQGPTSHAVKISGDDKNRIFFVEGTLYLKDIELMNGCANGHKGGSGGYKHYMSAEPYWRGSGGGGGSAGMGGAIFVSKKGMLFCERVTFSNNKAIGGSGGDHILLDGNEYDCQVSAFYGGGGAGFGQDGKQCGAHIGGDGGDGGMLNGQGGAGTNDKGNDGDTEGGGGGGGCNGGGKGGFSAGGGGTAIWWAGEGGYGGGGGAKRDGNSGAAGGNFAGKGGSKYGGGGAGLGGAIFVRKEGVLTLRNCSFKNNSATGGGSAGGGERGQGKGGAIFIMDWVDAQVEGLSFSGNSSQDKGENKDGINLGWWGPFTDTNAAYGKFWELDSNGIEGPPDTEVSDWNLY